RHRRPAARSRALARAPAPPAGRRRPHEATWRLPSPLRPLRRGMRILLMAFTLVLAACASTRATRLDATQIARIDAVLAEQQAREHIPGLAMVIVQDGEIVYARTLGQRDIERDLPVTLDTAFPIGSV